MRAIICSMILLCALPVNAAWNLSWDFAKPYLSLPTMPELPSLKPYVGWVFGTTCLVASIAYAVLKNQQMKYQVPIIKNEAIKEYEEGLQAGGIYMYKGKELIERIGIKGVFFDFKLNAITVLLSSLPENYSLKIIDNSDQDTSPFIEIARKRHQTRCVTMDGNIFNNNTCKYMHRVEMRFKEGVYYYRPKEHVSINDLTQCQILETVSK